MNYTTKVINEVEVGLIPKTIVEVYIDINDLKVNKEQIRFWLDEINRKFRYYPGEIIEESNQLKLPGVWAASDFLSFDPKQLRVENEQELKQIINQIK